MTLSYGVSIGIAIVIIGSIISNFGVNLQKYAHMQNSAQKDFKRFRLLWSIGIIAVTLGAITDFVALSFAPQSLVAPLGSVTLLANVFFAHFWLGEAVTRQDVAATFLVLVGAIVTTLSSNHHASHYSVDTMKSFLQGEGFLIYVGLLLVLVSSLFFLLWTSLNKQRKAETNINNTSDVNNSKLIPFLYASLSGIFGAQSVLFAKMIGESIKQTIGVHSKENVFCEPFPYLVLFALLLSILLQTYLLNLGLKDYDAVLIFPIFQIFWILFSVFGGLIYFRELSRLSNAQITFFALAIVQLTVGVYFLAQHEMVEIINSKQKKMSTSILAVMFAKKWKKKSLNKIDSDNDNKLTSSKEKTTLLPKNKTPTSTKSHSKSISFRWSLLGSETAILNSEFSESESDSSCSEP